MSVSDLVLGIFKRMAAVVIVRAILMVVGLIMVAVAMIGARLFLQ
jgi:hypothetical protein